MNTLGIDVPLLSDLNGEATRGFGVSFELFGIQNVAARSCFLIEDAETIRGALLGSELPDVDGVIEAAREFSG